MDLVGTAEAVMLRSQEGSYMSAHDNKKTVRQDKDGSSANAKWVVERVEGKPNVIRLKSCFGQYLSAIDRKVDWVLILYRVCGKLKSWGEKLLQTDGEPDSGIFNLVRWVGELLQTYWWPRPASQNWNWNWTANLMRGVGRLLQFCCKLVRPDSIKNSRDGTSWHVEAPCELQPNLQVDNLIGWQSNSVADKSLGLPSLQVNTTVNLYGLQITQQTTMVAFGGSHINPSRGWVSADNSSSSGNYYPLSQRDPLPFVATQFRHIGCIGPKIGAFEEIVDTTKNAEQVVGFGYSGSTPRCESHNQTVSVSLTHTEKPDIFSGANFKTWQQKMLFSLTMLNMAHLLKEDPPMLGEDQVNATTQLAVDIWSHLDFVCRNIIMNGLSDAMYRRHSTSKTAKELWNSLERKYTTKYAGPKKLLVAKFLRFSMVDSKTVVSQVLELQLIIQEILAENMVIDERFQVDAIIEKLPPSWKEFKNYLMYNRKKMTVEDLIVILSTKEDNKSAARLSSSASPSKRRINKVECKENCWKEKKHQERSSLGPKRGIVKKPKFNGNCLNCSKTGHKSSNCSLPKRVKIYDADDVEAIAQKCILHR